MSRNGTVAYVTKLPPCDVCAMEGAGPNPATYDAKTVMGPWANLCTRHFGEHTTGELGTGAGQKLEVRA